MKEKNLLPANIKIKVLTMKLQLNLVKSLLAVASVATLSAVSAAPASAFSFGNIAGGDTVGDAYVNDFSFDVTDGGSDNVFFKIANNNTSVPGIFIGSVYFDTGYNTNLLSAFGINTGNTGTVDFKDNGTANMPQSSNLTTPWSTDFSATKNGAGSNGVQTGEALGLSFGGNYTNVVSALNAGTLRLGLHVQGINGGSDTFVSSISTSNTEATPEPLTMLAAGAAVGFGTMFKKQRAQAHKAQ
ncbi:MULTISPECIES: PEP-CTERM sorting domain-containing protein [unclassified Microcoleus]|uniref:PEP-CTERM sorting domain-containing protein n=1 Tax=unclassified Microcoleus TaxID=2642155 RepID=UPI002FD6CD18